MDLFKKINLLITGSSKEYSLKQRIFSSSCFWIAIIGVKFTLFSIVENNLLQIGIASIGTIGFILLHYLSRKKNIFNKWIFLLALSSFISASWFFFGGLNGPSLFLFILGSLTYFGIFERKEYLLITIIVTTNVLLLWFIEVKFPDLIFSYFTYNSTYIIVSFFATLFFASLIIAQLTFNFSEEQIKTETEKKKIESLHNDMLESIKYANNIQTALLPNTEILNKNLNENFILFKPKSIVSGDFYWVKKIRNKVIFAVADCTGHGVPGAFMSMLGISFLNEIVVGNNLSSDVILDRLREKVKTAFSFNEELTINDGMDIALCVIDFDDMKLQYSGAYNPLYLCRNNVLTEYKADRQPIGNYPKEKKFTLNKIDLQKNDVLYMFTDGYKDQRGGKNGNKFMTKRFKELLLNIHKKELSVQKEILNKTFEDWKNEFSNQQTYSFDDIETILLSINKELIANKIKEANSIIENLKQRIYNEKNISISNFKEIINDIKINKKTKHKIINTANLQIDDVVVAGIKI